MALRRVARLARSRFRTALILLLASVLPAWSGPDDAFIAGYVAAVLERQFNVNTRSVTVTNGVLSIDAADLPLTDRSKIVNALSAIRGITRVDVRAPVEPAARIARPPSVGFLPVGQLFRPLIADPRWPHFGATLRYYLRNTDSDTVAAVSLGETLPFYRDDIGDNGRWGQWETGLQVGVFSIFDLDSPSFDLINTDFFAAVFGAYRLDAFSALARVFHQSSHLGDELLLRKTRPNRENLSYEGVDVKVAYDLPWGLRPYGGAGYLFDVDPSSLDRGLAQGGLEFASPWTFVRGRVRPIAAVDVQFREENDWRRDVSARAGLQLESVSVFSRNLQVLLEYFNGFSFEGQFYRQPVEYLGLGAHFNF